jgi:hypothetical protein
MKSNAKGIIKVIESIPGRKNVTVIPPFRMNGYPQEMKMRCRCGCHNYSL